MLTKKQILDYGSSLEQRLLSEIQVALQVRIKLLDFRRTQLRPFEGKQHVFLEEMNKYQCDFYTLLPLLPADVDKRDFETLWSRQMDHLKSLRHELSLALADAKSQADNRFMQVLTGASLLVAFAALGLVIFQIKMANDQDVIVKSQLSTMQAQHEVMKTQDERLKDQTVIMEQQNKLLGEQGTVMQRQFAILEKQDRINTRLSLKKPNLLVEDELHETLVNDSSAAPKPRYDLQFKIYNSGDKSARNYTVYLFVPSGVETLTYYLFYRAPEPIKIDDRDYYYFTLFMRDPIASLQRVRLGSFSIQGPLKELPIRWKIETEDDGAFPQKPNEKLGQLIVPIKTP